MKTADEIANDFENGMDQYWDTRQHRIFVQTLIDYAEEVAKERVKKASEGYAKGIDDAAKICDKYSQFKYSADTMIEAENMAREIRALVKK